MSEGYGDLSSFEIYDIDVFERLKYAPTISLMSACS